MKTQGRYTMETLTKMNCQPQNRLVHGVGEARVEVRTLVIAAHVNCPEIRQVTIEGQRGEACRDYFSKSGFVGTARCCAAAYSTHDAGLGAASHPNHFATLACGGGAHRRGLGRVAHPGTARP